MTWFEKIIPSRIKTERRTRSVPEGLWMKCPACDSVLYRPEVERNVYEQIMACDDPAGRRMLMRHRGLILSKMLDAIKIANLEHRLAEAEARLRPRLVED